MNEKYLNVFYTLIQIPLTFVFILAVICIWIYGFLNLIYYNARYYSDKREFVQILKNN